MRSAGISAVVENERILELPLNGRNPADLVLMVGAAVQTATATSRSAPGGVRISVGGGFETGVAYVLDGADHNNQQENINYALPFPDALQEFRVATSGLTAQNGVKSGAAVNAVTKSGTNRFSGNAFEFMRHYRFNATNPFAAIGPDGERTDDGLKRNQFGGTLGGPIVRDKLFFFGAYQATANRQRPAANIAWVPTAQMLTGDLTTFASAQCNGGRAGAAASAVREQPARSGSPQPGRAEHLRPAAQVDRSVRQDHLSRSGTTATSIRRSGASTSSSRPITPSSGGTSGRSTPSRRATPAATTTS